MNVDDRRQIAVNCGILGILSSLRSGLCRAVGQVVKLEVRGLLLSNSTTNTLQRFVPATLNLSHLLIYPVHSDLLF